MGTKSRLQEQSSGEVQNCNLPGDLFVSTLSGVQIWSTVFLGERVSFRNQEHPKLDTWKDCNQYRNRWEMLWDGNLQWSASGPVVPSLVDIENRKKAQPKWWMLLLSYSCESISYWNIFFWCPMRLSYSASVIAVLLSWLAIRTRVL